MLVYGAFSWAQSSYNIVSLGSSYSQSQIDQAIQNADLCGFYYENENRKMTFDDGAIVELNSSSIDNTIDQSCTVPVHSGSINEYWEISPTGHLLRRLQTFGK